MRIAIIIYSYFSLVMRKPAFCIMQKQRRSNCEADHAFVSAIRIIHSLYYLNPKFQASSNVLWLYSLVCVGPDQKHRRPVSHNEAHLTIGLSRPYRLDESIFSERGFLSIVFIFISFFGEILVSKQKRSN